MPKIKTIKELKGRMKKNLTGAVITPAERRALTRSLRDTLGATATKAELRALTRKHARRPSPNK